jgi:hypothetical protein
VKLNEGIMYDKVESIDLLDLRTNLQSRHQVGDKILFNYFPKWRFGIIETSLVRFSFSKLNSFKNVGFLLELQKVDITIYASM